MNWTHSSQNKVFWSYHRINGWTGGRRTSWWTIDLTGDGRHSIWVIFSKGIILLVKEKSGLMNFDSIRLTFLSLFIIVTTRPFDNFPFTQILVVRNNTICISGEPKFGFTSPSSPTKWGADWSRVKVSDFIKKTWGFRRDELVLLDYLLKLFLFDRKKIVLRTTSDCNCH